MNCLKESTRENESSAVSFIFSANHISNCIILKLNVALISIYLISALYFSAINTIYVAHCFNIRCDIKNENTHSMSTSMQYGILKLWYIFVARHLVFNIYKQWTFFTCLLEFLVHFESSSSVRKLFLIKGLYLTSNDFQELFFFFYNYEVILGHYSV